MALLSNSFLCVAAASLCTISASAHSPRADLSVLFDAPTVSEIARVRTDWATRQPEVAGYRVEASGTDAGGVRFDVVSHISEGQRHYGAVRYPRNYAAGQPYGTLVVCHGGLNGVAAEESANFLLSLPGICVDENYFLVIPSYRGEQLVTQFAGTWVSGGSPSWADRDVDDTASLLAAVQMNIPDMDQARVGAWGISRGAAVAMLLAARDDRIRRVVDLFGWTDLSLPSVQSQLDLILNQGVQPAGIGRVAYESFVFGWLNGVLSLDEARQAWIRRSPCYFANTMPPIQAHHGLQDTQIDPSHTQVLLGALSSLGLGPPDVEGFFYPNGAHGINSLVGLGDRVEPYLCALEDGPRAYCGPMAPHALGLYAGADYRGSSSITRNDFELRANNCRPNTVGLVFVSSNTAYVPAGAGFLCVGAGSQRLGAGLIDAAGTFRMSVDLANPNPNVANFLAPGQKAFMQVVFRDVGNPMGSFNFSNGLQVLIEP
ncbi:Alpha/beta hydrolase family protein [Planctomycetes bacterium Poly30]|uniref:Alpha/beta hydrolase family protein n=1 Tax=Saltatorellus ferox TaxID=2528018 RepID=A0A518EXL5_9BACT|nr:Alpha/beta hydrolase family protein [Planctomycetes bacterium Poly30]